MKNKIIYQSKNDKPFWKIAICSLPIFFIAGILSYGINNISVVNYIIFGIVLFFLFFYIVEVFFTESQTVVITTNKIIIYPNKYQKKWNKYPIQEIYLDEVKDIKINGRELNFQIKPRIVDKYQYQDEVTMLTSGWPKSKKIKKEIEEVLNL